MTDEEKKQVLIDKITDELSSQSLESLKKLYDLVTQCFH